MSYVVEVRRQAQEPGLTPGDIERLLEADRSLVKINDNLIEWSQPEKMKPLYINVEVDRLWTDSIGDETQEIFLNKLREMAGYLDARVYGEEGEDLTDEHLEDRIPSKNGFAAIMGFIFFALTIPFFALAFVLRLPWALWKISRTSR